MRNSLFVTFTIVSLVVVGTLGMKVRATVVAQQNQPPQNLQLPSMNYHMGDPNVKLAFSPVYPRIVIDPSPTPVAPVAATDPKVCCPDFNVPGTRIKNDIQDCFDEYREYSLTNASDILVCYYQASCPKGKRLKETSPKKTCQAFQTGGLDAKDKSLTCNESMPGTLYDCV